MSVTLKTNAMKYRDPDDGTYKGVDVVAETATSTQKAAIQSEGATQVAAVQAASDVAQSILPDGQTLNNLSNDFAPQYSPSATYAVGDYCVHDYVLYKCNTAITTAENWTAAHWTAVSTSSEITSVNNAFEAYTEEELYYKTIKNSYVKKDGKINGYSGWARSDFVKISDYAELKAITSEASQYNCFYEDASEESFINWFEIGTTETVIPIPVNANYVMFSNSAAGMENLSVHYVTKLDKTVEVLEKQISEFEFEQGYWDTVTDEVTGLPKIALSLKRICAKNALWYSQPSFSVEINGVGGYYYSFVWAKNGVLYGSSWYNTDKDFALDCDYFFVMLKKMESGYDVYIYPDDQSNGLSITINNAIKYVSPMTFLEALWNDGKNSREGGEKRYYGFSPDYNTAFDTIENFDYSGDPNPWTEIENPTDFETYGTYIDNKIDSIPEGKQFIWITDVHYPTNQKHSGALVDYVRRRACIKTVIHGGDVQNERPYAIDAAKDWLDFNKDYVGRIGSDFKQLCGDHDHNGQYWGKVELRQQYNLTDPAETFFTCKFVQKVLTGYCENEIVYDTIYDNLISGYGWASADVAEYNAFKKMHYYFDDCRAKTRFIVLWTGWSWPEYGFPYNKMGGVNPLIVQMDFLYQALMTLPPEYNVVVCGHRTFISQYKESVGGYQYYDTSKTVYQTSGWKFVSEMLAKFKTKGTTTGVKCSDWSTAYSSLDDVPIKAYDFSFAPDANYVMTYGGDVHWDVMCKFSVSDIDTITTLQTGATVNKATEILNLVTMTDGKGREYRDYTTREPICNPATPGTIDEQAFDVISLIDNKIHLTRIGSGSDREILFI